MLFAITVQRKHILLLEIILKLERFKIAISQYETANKT